MYVSMHVYMYVCIDNKVRLELARFNFQYDLSFKNILLNFLQKFNFLISVFSCTLLHSLGLILIKVFYVPTKVTWSLQINMKVNQYT